MPTGLSVEDATRALLLLGLRLVGRAKRMPVPDELRGLALAPRHLSMLSYLLFDGPMTVNDLAARLEVAPTTVSLMVGELSRKGVIERREDDDDRRRRIVSIAPDSQRAITGWLGHGATAWRHALDPLTPAQRQVVVDTLRRYLEGLGEPPPDPPLTALKREALCAACSGHGGTSMRVEAPVACGRSANRSRRKHPERRGGHGSLDLQASSVSAALVVHERAALALAPGIRT